MSDKHSPGPWRWELLRGSYLGGRLRDANNADIAESCDYGDSVAISEADARLIAAAPEMLELLRRIDPEEDCQFCWGWREMHNTDCPLGALLYRIDGEPQ